jgi:cell wall-associated NlpC family hydrolase
MYALGVAICLIAFVVVGWLIGLVSDGKSKQQPDAAKQPETTQQQPNEVRLIPEVPGAVKKPTGQSEEPDEGVQNEKEPTEPILVDEVSPITEDGHSIEDMKKGDSGLQMLAPFSTGKVYPQNTNITAMIDYGKKYLGTPYEYGSDRKTDTTFDCSDFVQWVFKRTLGMQLPMSSQKQKDYVKQYGSHRYADWRRATPGDLFFFSSYRGSKKENYADVQRDVTPVTHCGIYIGKTPEGKHLLLHTASNPTGVRIQTIDGTHLEYRIVYTGRAY